MGSIIYYICHIQVPKVRLITVMYFFFFYVGVPTFYTLLGHKSNVLKYNFYSIYDLTILERSEFRILRKCHASGPIFSKCTSDNRCLKLSWYYFLILFCLDKFLIFFIYNMIYENSVCKKFVQYLCKKTFFLKSNKNIKFCK